MSATRLLVLGLVRSLGRTHGYVISKQLLSWRVDVWANTKTGSIYHALRTLSKEGMLSALDVASSDFGPPRTEYEITKSGDDEFFALMREGISAPDSRYDMLCASLVFLTCLTRAEAIALFIKRVELLTVARAQITIDLNDADKLDPAMLPPHRESLGNFWIHWVETADVWSRQMVKTLQSGAYVFADEEGAKVLHPPGTI